VEDFDISFPHLKSSARACAACIVSKAQNAVQHCIGFIDGTLTEIAKPKEAAQRATYSGHKRFNGLKYQIVAMSNGMIFNIFGPWEGRRHCGAIPADSYLITPVPQITPPTTYSNLASAATKYCNDSYTNIPHTTIAPDARSEGYRHPPCSLNTVRRLIATYRTMAHSLSYYKGFGSAPLLTVAGSCYVRTVVLALHCQTLPKFNVG
jgi:DDE superfamily endonuclease